MNCKDSMMVTTRVGRNNEVYGFGWNWRLKFSGFIQPKAFLKLSPYNFWVSWLFKLNTTIDFNVSGWRDNLINHVIWWSRFLEIYEKLDFLWSVFIFSCRCSLLSIIVFMWKLLLPDISEIFCFKHVFWDPKIFLVIKMVRWRLFQEPYDTIGE